MWAFLMVSSDVVYWWIKKNNNSLPLSAVNQIIIKFPLLAINFGVLIFNLFVSFCSDSSLSKMSPCSEAGKLCNPCLDAAKACNLNETCKRLKSAYNSICSKAMPPQPSLANQEPCSRKRCQKVSAQSSFIYLLFIFLFQQHNWKCYLLVIYLILSHFM